MRSMTFFIKTNYKSRFLISGLWFGGGGLETQNTNIGQISIKVKVYFINLSYVPGGVQYLYDINCLNFYINYIILINLAG